MRNQAPLQQLFGAGLFRREQQHPYTKQLFLIEIEICGP